MDETTPAAPASLKKPDATRLKRFKRNRGCDIRDSPQHPRRKKPPINCRQWSLPTPKPQPPNRPWLAANTQPQVRMSCSTNAIGATFLICAMAIGLLEVYRKYGRKVRARRAECQCYRFSSLSAAGDNRSVAWVKSAANPRTGNTGPNSNHAVDPDEGIFFRNRSGNSTGSNKTENISRSADRRFHASPRL